MYDRYGVTKNGNLVQHLETEKGYTIKIGDKIVRQFGFGGKSLEYYSGLIEKEISFSEFIVLNAIDKEVNDV